MIFLCTLLLSVLITIVMVPICTELAIMFYLLDIPDERKVHTRPIPRIGGIAIVLGAFTPIVIWHHSAGYVTAYLAGAALLALFGAVDDFRGLSPKAKFAGQFLAALIIVLYGGLQIKSLGGLLPDAFLLPDIVSIPFTIFVIVGVTNAINLSDGLDGLAGGICLLILAGIGYLAYLDDNATVGLISLALGGALFGFLRYNTHPASIFMGDCGSQFLGFSVITLSLALTQGHSTPLSPILPLILIGFPVLDTLTVMSTRIARGRSPFAADRNHFHHNLMALGFLHQESVLIIYVVQTLLLLAAVIFRFYSDWLLLAGYLLFSTLLLLVFSHAARTEKKVKRTGLFDSRIAGRLRLLKRDGTVIKASFPVFEAGIPLLLFITCNLAHESPPFIPLICAILAVLVLLVWRFKKERLAGVMRFALYLAIPCAVYLSEASLADISGNPLARLYNGSFGFVAVLIILITKFSRRKQGFHSSPMDFLIIILALVVPNFPDQKIQEFQLGLIAAKIILLYFSYEVLLAELRGKINRVALATVASLVVLAVK
jgi:UDP-GlcNAc:undecaprenyl-phosphate/decaprenyl-phosphate GlcNAc-1-phosphate transferase